MNQNDLYGSKARIGCNICFKRKELYISPLISPIFYLFFIEFNLLSNTASYCKTLAFSVLASKFCFYKREKLLNLFGIWQLPRYYWTSTFVVGKNNKKCTLPFPIFELVHIQFIWSFGYWWLTVLPNSFYPVTNYSYRWWEWLLPKQLITWHKSVLTLTCRNSL